MITATWSRDAGIARCLMAHQVAVPELPPIAATVAMLFT